MLKNTEIKQVIKDHLDELHCKYAVSEIGIFGSYVRNEQTPQSDVDILVEFSKPVGFVAFMHLEERLQELLGTKIDLVSRAALKHRLASTFSSLPHQEYRTFHDTLSDSYHVQHSTDEVSPTNAIPS